MKRIFALTFLLPYLFIALMAAGGCATKPMQDMAADVPVAVDGSERPGSKAEKDPVLHGRSAEAQYLYDKARANEKHITPEMLRIAGELGGKMVGLQYSVKTASSVEDKIQRRLKDSRGSKSDVQIVAEMGDLVRYTLEVEHGNLVPATRGTIAKLQELGYTVKKLDNRFLVPNASYMGIHLDVVAPQGQLFELQIHSPDSRAIKDATHEKYEEARSVDTHPKRAKEILEEMRGEWAKLPRPAGIENLTNFPVEK